jgi:ubiquinone biosynthesis accessory factor UbiK
MKKSHFLTEIASRLCEALPKNAHTLKKDLEKNFHGVLMSAFTKLELVTREEFDTQTKVLSRTRKKLEEMENELSQLEKKLKQKSEKK